MRTVTVRSSKEYEVLIGSGLLASAGGSIKPLAKGKKAFIVSDDNVYPVYGRVLDKSLRSAGFSTDAFVMPHGEASKNLSVYGAILERMGSLHYTRTDIIVALGGGVVGDITGFAAATYQRGIDYVQIPTTLLAAVDSSVGGKTGVDLECGKNQVGCFCQPLIVIHDVDTLRTLPNLEYRNGCAEIIKYGMIGSRELMDAISARPVNEQYEDVIAVCVDMKRKLVEEDEFDRGSRMLLNFGHTVGHAIERCSNYTIPHGMAVSAGMDVITKAAAVLGFTDGSAYEALHGLLEQYSLPARCGYPAEKLLEAAQNDKKSGGDVITIVVPRSAGDCILKMINRPELMKWLLAGGVK